MEWPGLNEGGGHLPLTPLGIVTASQVVFLLVCFQSPDFCALGERQAQDQLKICEACAHTDLLHPSQDLIQLLPLARARSLWRACWPI